MLLQEDINPYIPFPPSAGKSQGDLTPAAEVAQQVALRGEEHYRAALPNVLLRHHSPKRTFTACIWVKHGCRGPLRQLLPADQCLTAYQRTELQSCWDPGSRMSRCCSQCAAPASTAAASRLSSELKHSKSGSGSNRTAMDFLTWDQAWFSSTQ